TISVEVGTPRLEPLLETLKGFKISLLSICCFWFSTDQELSQISVMRNPSSQTASDREIDQKRSHLLAGEPGAYPSSHWVEGRIHPGQVASPSQGSAPGQRPDCGFMWPAVGIDLLLSLGVCPITRGPKLYWHSFDRHVCHPVNLEDTRQAVLFL
ncbi:hypothetical protein MHYP_G00350630, partial [Metynnis hypsauchen]